MRIGIIGAGNVGGMLGKLWAARGHDVTFGMRDPGTIRGDAKHAVDVHGAKTASIRDAGAAAEVIVLAVPAAAVEEIITIVGDWSGKVVIDANNRFAPSESGRSLAEDIAALIPSAKVVKAFNTVGANRFENPMINGQAISMFICGDDAGAKSTVGNLVEELGFDLVDVGGLSQAALLESMAKLWVSLARSGFGRDMGFRLLR